MAYADHDTSKARAGRGLNLPLTMMSSRALNMMKSQKARIEGRVVRAKDQIKTWNIVKGDKVRFDLAAPPAVYECCSDRYLAICM